MKRKITIRDVAAMAEVSNQTVSRVINDRPDVAEDTRSRVWRVIEELNYHPNAIARSLIQQRSLALGVVTAGLRYLGPSQTLNGITFQAEEMGYSLLLKELPGFRTMDTQPLLNTLLARQVEGIIWAVPEIGDNRDWLQPEFEGSLVPTIFLTMETRTGISTVSVDNYLGGRMATEHLLSQGYAHIGHLTGPLDWWEARQRLLGWQDALREAGRPIHDAYTAAGNWSAASGAHEIQRLLDSYPEMDAVFVGNDQMALGVLQIASKKGIRVPEDLAIVGFDGIPESAYYSPPLTTIYQDLRDMGCTAVRELVGMVEESHRDHEVVVPKRISLQPELVVRASSIPVR
jgi:LacI family transcriptional regulator